MEGSGIPFLSQLNPRVLKVFQNRHVRRFGPSHMCVLLSNSLMLYVYCFEFVLLANRLQNISRTSFPLLPSPPPNHTEQDRASSNPSRCFIFAVHSECGQYYFFFFPFYLDCVAVRTSFFFPLCSVSNCQTNYSLTLSYAFQSKSQQLVPLFLQKDLGGEGKLHSNRLMAYLALSIACI